LLNQLTESIHSCLIRKQKPQVLITRFSVWVDPIATTASASQPRDISPSVTRTLPSSFLFHFFNHSSTSNSVGYFWQKWPFSDQKKWHFEWPNQNSKTTFIVQTFPKYGPYGFDLVNLSLLGAILAIFQFCGFSGLFWPFFPCKKCKNENLSLNFNFWSITLKFFL